MAPVLLLLGAGNKIGLHVSKAFLTKGYKVALVSRSIEEKETANEIAIRADFADPDCIPKIFDKVRAGLGTPTVVIYNAYHSNPGDAKDPAALPVSLLSKALAINTLSPYVAVQEFVKAKAPGTFIFTGNYLNTHPYASMLHFGMGKAAAANLMQAASQFYEQKFYYADERQEDGDAMWKGTSGPAAAEHYVKLVEEEKGPWLQTFVEGIGYKKFSS